MWLGARNRSGAEVGTRHEQSPSLAMLPWGRGCPSRPPPSPLVEVWLPVPGYQLTKGVPTKGEGLVPRVRVPQSPTSLPSPSSRVLSPRSLPPSSPV